MIDGKRYYLPTKEEWLAIIPGDESNNIFDGEATENKLPIGPASKVKFGNKLYTMKGRFYKENTPGVNQVYGAYTYTPMEVGEELYVIASYEFKSDMFGAEKGALEIKMGLVDKPALATLTGAESIKAKFTNLPVSTVASRVLRAVGLWIGNSSPIFNSGKSGYYWAATEVGNSTFSNHFYIGGTSIRSFLKLNGASVRLFARD